MLKPYHRRHRAGRATAAALVAAISACAPSAWSATKTWDLDSAGSNNGVIDNGSGTWDTNTTANWTLNGGTTNTVWSDNDDAIFGGNPGTGAAGTITLSGTINANSIHFNPAASGNFSLTGGTALTLTGAGGVITTNADASIDSVIAGSVGLTKRGASTLTVTGSSTNNGAILVSNGTLILSGANGSLASASGYTIGAGGTLRLDNSGSTNSDRLGSVDVAMNGGTLNFIGAAGLTENVGNFSSAVGANTLSLSGPATTTLAFGSFGRSAGSTINFTGASTSNRATFTGVTANSFLNAGAYVDGANFAWYDTGGFVRAIQYTGTPDTNTATSMTSARHVRLTADATSSSISILSLNLSGGGVDLNFSNNTSITVTTGGIIKSGGGTGSFIQNGNANPGTLTTGSGSVEWVIRTDTVNDQLTISKILTSGSGLTKTGAGVLILNNAGNNYGGTTTVAQGTLRVSAAGSVPDTSAVVVGEGATFDLNGASETVGNLTLFGGATIAASSGTPTLTLNSNTGSITYNGLNSGATISVTRLSLAATNTAAVHNITVADGDAATDLNITSIIQNNGANAQGIDKLGLGTLRLGGANIYTGVTNISAGTLQLDGSTVAASTVNVGTAAALTGSGTANGNATLTGNGVINFSSGGTIAGTLGVTGGFWNGLGSVTGATTVSSGTYTVNGTMAGAGGLTLNSGTNLAGTGTINKTLTLGGSNTLSSTGTLTIGSAVNWNTAGNTISSGTISTTGDTISNSLAVNGTLGGTGTTAITTAGTLSGTGTVNKNATITGNGIVNFGSGGSINGTLGVTGGNWNGQGGVTGTTSLSSGTFTVNGTMNGAGAMDVNNTSKLQGTGTVAKTVNVNSGGTISPAGDGNVGTTVGTLSTNHLNLNDGGNYIFEVKDATGSAGTGYDTVAVSGAINVNASTSSPNQFTVKITAYAGQLQNWNNVQVYHWDIASASSVNGFTSSDQFVLDTSGFEDDYPKDIGSHWEINQVGNNIRVSYIPEPGSMMLLGGLGLGLLGRRRRRIR